MAAAVSSGPTAATAIGTPAASSGGPAPPPQPPTEYLNEVPSSLKQLARIVVRGFYGVEDALIIDMLVRYTTAVISISIFQYNLKDHFYYFVRLDLKAPLHERGRRCWIAEIRQENVKG